MPYLSFLWSFFLFQTVAQAIPVPIGESAIAQFGVAGIIFVIWVFTFRYFSKQQNENFQAVLQVYNEKYENALKKSVDETNTIISTIHRENMQLVERINKQNEDTLKRVERQADEYSKSLTIMIERQFKNLEKEHEYKEAILGSLADLRIKINKQGDGNE